MHLGATSGLKSASRGKFWTADWKAVTADLKPSPNMACCECWWLGWWCFTNFPYDSPMVPQVFPWVPGWFPVGSHFRFYGLHYVNSDVSRPFGSLVYRFFYLNFFFFTSTEKSISLFNLRNLENVLQRNLRTGTARECIFRASGGTRFKNFRQPWWRKGRGGTPRCTSVPKKTMDTSLVNANADCYPHLVQCLQRTFQSWTKKWWNLKH